MAVMAGVDMSMVPFDFSFYDHCVNLANKDNKFKERVNDAVLRILRVKKLLGILEHSSNIYPDAKDLQLIGTEESEMIALDASRESIVLAKNSNSDLPLAKSSNILVVGPTGNLLKVLNGGWSYTWQGNNETYFQTFSKTKYNTIYEAIKSHTTGNVAFMQGVDFESYDNEKIKNTAEQAKLYDLVVLCVGEDTYTETPGNIGNLMLSDSQLLLADSIINTGKKVILVYVGGRPRTITNIVKRVNAVVIAFLPGNRGGDAIADVIFGDYNPNGRLPITYPKTPNGAMTYDYKPLENWETWLGEDVASYFDALFPFGHGLSYTNFEYSELKLDQATVLESSSITGSVKVKNTGNRPGKETVIVYLNDEFGSLSRPIKQMKFFKKLSLNPNQQETVTFEITRYDMSFINLKNERIVESGKFNVYIDNLKTSFELIAKASSNTSNSFYYSPNRFFVFVFGLLINLFF